MNTLVITTLLVLALSLAAGQSVRANRRGQRNVGAQAADSLGSSLQAGNRDLDAQQALLEKQQRRQAVSIRSTFAAKHFHS